MFDLDAWPVCILVVVQVSLNLNRLNAKQGRHGVRVNLDELDVRIMPSGDRSCRDVSAMVEAFGLLFYNPESVEFVSELHIVATSYQQ